MIMFKRTYENRIATAQNVGWHNGYDSAKATYHGRALKAEDRAFKAEQEIERLKDEIARLDRANSSVVIKRPQPWAAKLAENVQKESKFLALLPTAPVPCPKKRKKGKRK